MQLKRVIALMMLTLALVACGGAEPATQAPADSNTGQTEATTEPATTDATPEASDPGGSTGSFDIANFPAPPSGSAIKQGEDPTFDMLISAMGPAMAEASKQNGGTTTEPMYFKSSATLEEIGAFYAKELPGMGLQDPGTNQAPMAGTLSQVYITQDLSGGVVLMAFDGATMGATGNLVMVVGFSK